jgi:hypothetical protein
MMLRFNKVTALLFGLAIIFSSCQGDYTISQLFDKKDCNGPCYQRMECEGNEITVKVTLNGSNVLQNGHMYFVRDADDMTKTIKVEFDQAVPKETQELMKTSIGKTARITGHIEGYDLLSPESCRRAHIIYVRSADDISFN